MKSAQSPIAPHLVLTVLFISVALAGCPSAADDGRGSTAGTFGGVAGTFGSTAGVDGNPTAGTTGFAGMNGTAGTGTDVPNGLGGRRTSGSTAMPCDIADIVKLRCQSCHAATPISGVPMAIMSWEDTQQPAVSDSTKKVADLMKSRAHDTVAPMPPTGIMPAADLAKLDAWIDGGALAGTDPSCAPKPPEMYGGEMPPDVENCYEIRAHKAKGDNSPLISNGEHYATFYFDAPWPDGSQGVYFETLPGDKPEILHHWLVYAEESGNQPDGTVEYPAPGSHASAPTLVAGWAPGANNNDIPSDVGLQLSAPNKKMSLEIHFFGPANTPIPTNAGVKICTVETKLRKHTATISWLGTELGINIPPKAQDSVATGTCTPQYSGDITILRSWPHMHLMGRSMDSVIIRKDGTRESMSPTGGWPFDFNNEVSHETKFVLKAGDKVETKCHYTNTSNRSIAVGFENEFEMCFNFVTAYPAKALVNKGFGASTSLTNSATACLY